MTKRIYIRGDVSQPLTLQIYDADNGGAVEATMLDIHLSVGQTVTSARLKPLHGATYDVDVVPAPAHKAAGRTVFDIDVAKERAGQPHARGDRLQATLTRYLVDDQGLVMKIGSQVYCSKEVPDQELAAARDPKILIREAAAFVIDRVLNSEVISPLLYGTLGPAVETPPNTPCGECGGSGEYVSQITHKTTPCSKGCKKP